MSGPFINDNGDVVSSALDIDTEEDITLIWSNYELCVGQVIKIYDLSDLKSHPHGQDAYCTVYDVMISMVDGSTSIIKGCVVAQPAFGGGINNYLEVIQTDPKFNEFGARADSRDKLQAHYVVVGFVSGSMDAGVILGTLPHPNAIPSKVRQKFKANEVHTEGEIQGLNFKVDKDGAFTLTFQGPRNDDPQAKGKAAGQIKAKQFRGEGKEQKSELKDPSGQLDFPSEDAPTVLNIDKDGNITVTNNQKQRIKINRQDKTIRIDNDKTYINMMQGDDGDHKVQVVASKVEIGHSNGDTTGSYKDGTQDLQPFVMGDDFQYFMEQLIEEICKIVHPTGVGPSGTPVNKPQFQQLKAKLPQLLSKKHKVEK